MKKKGIFLLFLIVEVMGLSLFVQAEGTFTAGVKVGDEINLTVEKWDEAKFNALLTSVPEANKSSKKTSLAMGATGLGFKMRYKVTSVADGTFYGVIPVVNVGLQAWNMIPKDVAFNDNPDTSATIPIIKDPATYCKNWTIPPLITLIPSLNYLNAISWKAGIEIQTDKLVSHLEDPTYHFKYYTAQQYDSGTGFLSKYQLFNDNLELIVEISAGGLNMMLIIIIGSIIGIIAVVSLVIIKKRGKSPEKVDKSGLPIKKKLTKKEKKLVQDERKLKMSKEEKKSLKESKKKTKLPKDKLVYQAGVGLTKEMKKARKKYGDASEDMKFIDDIKSIPVPEKEEVKISPVDFSEETPEPKAESNKCPECGWILSSTATKCVRCGWEKVAQKPEKEEVVEEEVKPLTEEGREQQIQSITSEIQEIENQIKEIDQKFFERQISQDDYLQLKNELYETIGLLQGKLSVIKGE